MDPLEAYDRYVQAWNEPANAAAILEGVWAETGVYADDEVPNGLVGLPALVALMKSNHADMPGFRVWSTTVPRMLAGRLAVKWEGSGGQPPIRSSGTDVIEFDRDGRIARVTDVFDTE